ncbi:MAG: hypothetical protein A2167_06220 [Planctomycetes bacterium RBG_13_46_10]|nr:MAG: hypothetical protein A2167_06220 [Planctomycetes bacterium RBG_13_46_10]
MKAFGIFEINFFIIEKPEFSLKIDYKYSIVNKQSSINNGLEAGGGKMNTFWLKITGFAVVVVIVIVIIGKFRSGRTTPAPAQQTQSKQEEKPKGFYGMAERDKQFLEEPKKIDEQKPEQSQEPVPQPQTQPVQQPAQAPVRPAGRTPGVVLPSDIIKPTTLYFKPLEEMEDIQAQELLPWATAGRSIGRLPMLQYGLMVKACRQIEERWPDSWYAFRAKQMLEEISERYAANYKITEQELNISHFLKPRRDTEPRTVEPIRR